MYADAKSGLITPVEFSFYRTGGLLCFTYFSHKSQKNFEIRILAKPIFSLFLSPYISGIFHFPVVQNLRLPPPLPQEARWSERTEGMGEEKKYLPVSFFFSSPNYDIKKACQTRRRRLRRLRSIFRRVCQRRGLDEKGRKKKMYECKDSFLQV